MSPDLTDEHFLQIINTSNEGIWIVNEKREPVFVNARAEEMLGYSHNELLDPEVFSRIFAKSEDIREAFATEPDEIRSFTGQFRHKDGSLIWAEGKTKPLIDPTGECRCTLFRLGDITEHRRIEDQLKAKELQMRLVIDTTPALISYIDKDYRYLVVNHTYSEWFSEAGDDLVGKTMAEVLGEEAFRALRPRVDAALAGKPQSFEVETPYKTGDRIIKATYTPDVAKDGAVRGIFVLVVDVTEQHNSEKALKESEDRYKAFIEHSTEGIWRFELEKPIPVDLPIDEQIRMAFEYGYLAECNDAMARQYGLSSAKEIVGTKLSDLWVPDDPNNLEVLRQFFESKYLLNEAESHEIGPDGKEYYFINNFVGQVEDGHFIRAWGTQRDISDRKAAEAAMARLASIVQTSEDAIISKDLNGVVTSWNAGAERMYGYKPDEIIGKSILTLIPEDRVAEEDFILSRIRAGENVSHYETVRRRKDGTDLDISVTISPIRDPSGRIVGASKIARDITRRKETERTLLESEMLRSMAMQSSKMGAWELDAETGLMNWSAELEDIFGLAPGTFPGTSDAFFDLIVPEDREMVWQEMNAALENRTNYSIEFQFLHADGSTRWMEGRGEAMYSDAGEPVRVYGIGIDITQRRRAEERELQLISENLETTAKFRAIFDQNFVFAGILDINGVVLDANAVALETCGYQLEDVVGKPFWETGWWHGSEESRSKMREGVQLAAKGIPFKDMLVYHWADESEHVVDFMLAPIRGSNGEVNFLYPTGVDVTDRREAETRLRESEERFSKAFNSSPLVVTITSLADGKLVEVNDTFVEVTGYSREEAIGKTTLELGLWSNETDRAEELAYLRQNGHVRNLEYSFRKRSGDEIVGLLSAERIDIGGEPYALSVIQDVTERKREEGNQKLLLRLGEMIREATDVGTLTAETCSMLCEHLQCDSCSFVENDLTFDTDFIRDGTELGEGLNTLGTVSLSSADGGESEPAEAGKTVVVTGREDGEDAQAHISVPLMQNGKLGATFVVTHNGPRDWTAREVGLVHTISERTWLAVEKLRSEEATRKSQEQVLQLADAMPQVVWVANKDGTVNYYNRKIDEFDGFKRRADQTWVWQPVVHPDDAELTAKAWRDSVTSATEYSVEHRLRMADGSYRWHLSRAVPGRDKNGNITQWYGTATDIQELKQAEETLLAAERRAADEYQALLERIVPLAQALGTERDLISIYRLLLEFVRTSMPCSGFFVSFYDEATQMRTAGFAWGSSGEVDTAKLPPIVLTDDGGPNSQAVFTKRPVVVSRYMEFMQGRPHIVIDEDGVNPNSSLVVPMTVMNRVMGTFEVQAYEDNAFRQEHIVALQMVANFAAVAIENARLIEVEAEARRDAEAANKTKDEFLSILSHELRTPLNSMLGWIRMLRGGMLDEELTAKAMEVIERNTRQQSSLIEDLLDVSRIISGKMRIEPQLVDAVAVAREATETFRPSALNKNLSLEFASDAPSLLVNGDPLRIQQVVANLVQNAIKFTPEQGSVSVSLKRIGNDLEITVLDTGIGIRKEFLPYIFDRFRQADASARRSYSGLGLGLTIVSTIVELHGGTITVDSDGENQGTVFRITLPLAEEFWKNENELAEALPDEQSPVAGATILIVEDDDESVVPLKLYLERQGAKVVSVTSARQAFEKLSEQDFSLIISDIGMPEMNGYDLIANLRSGADARLSSIPAIAMTAFVSPQDRSKALASGFHAHVSKPVDYELLMAVIKSVRGGSEAAA